MSHKCGEGEEPKPLVSREHKVPCDGWKETNEGNNGTTRKAARGTGCYNVGYCQYCKAVETFLEYWVDLVLNLSGESRRREQVRKVLGILEGKSNV